MMYVKNRLVFGFISKIVKTVFKAIYKFFGFFNLHLTMLVAVVGAILYLTGVLNSSNVALLIFYVLLILSVVYAIIKSIKQLLGLGKKVEKKKSMQIISSVNTVDGLSDGAETDETSIVNRDAYVDANQNRPIHYFTAKSNPNVIVCEYVDKYVLYLKTEGGYKYIRTDKKQVR